jgi:hypothetical protein
VGARMPDGDVSSNCPSMAVMDVASPGKCGVNATTKEGEEEK